ncbi:methyltransferase domain-containing protein, partial [Candidatus Bathyarchaeota archaeon]|nr:methyltransferase domain-containing protein [Candidatus Bathyarchaeota archaeon]
TVFDFWDRVGITKHWGGTQATQKLIQSCHITPHQHVLEIGCGTGYTTCLLAKKYQANVTALDISSKLLEQTKKRITKQNISHKITTIQADAQKLPFPANTFHAIIAESVLAFCHKKKASSEAHRVLKPKGIFAANEATYLKPPPKQLLTLFSESTLGTPLQVLQEDEWQAVLTQAGFTDISSTAYTLDLWKQFISNLRVDGARRYIPAIWQGIFDSTIRNTFLKKDMLKKSLQFLPYLGYGLYLGRKV